ncbi:putative secreted protein [Waddlia chondrophila 2032/99]|uniref:Putative secreted protein n=1 Tax=Waddlia chondrophila 2032/99 TaxID=765953 RepID=F8LDT7_9BACT|nr:putative secreted protein [Waddlia chondrophila 2032/99]
MFPPIDHTKPNVSAAVSLPETSSASQSKIQYFVINNFDFISTRTCRDLCITQIDSASELDSKVQQLVRTHFEGGQRVYKMHEKIAALDFKNIVVQDGENTQVISAESIKIIFLNDEEYDLMVDSFIEEHSTKVEEEADTRSIPLFSKQGLACIKAMTLVFRKNQEIVAFFTQVREQELTRVDEEIRERQTKNRDKRWNQWMDYWLQKDENRREILVTVLKNSLL